MTPRALILGLLGAIFIAGCGYLNDQVLVLASITAGHLLPLVVLVPLIVVLVTVNPLLALLGGRNLRPAELATILLLMFVSCSIPGRGLMETFTPTLAMPASYNRINPGWEARGLMSYVPAGMFPAGGQWDEHVTAGFINGRTSVPWQQWQAPLATWLPLVGLLAVSSICMGLIVHRQWSRREQLRYPISELAVALMRQDTGGALGPIFRARLFWLGLAVVLAIHLVNGLQAWFPASVRIPMQFDFSSAYVLARWISGPDWGNQLLIVRLYPTVIAFSFFLASDITLSLGLTQFAYIPLAATLIWSGVDMRSDYMAGGSVGWQRFGSYLAYALILLYIGRRYYGDLLRQGLGLGRRAGVEGYEAWALRVLVLAVASAVALLARQGLDWPLAGATVLLILLQFLCVSRVSAETGLFMVHPRWQALGVLLGAMGFFALGPSAAIIVGTVCAVLAIDASQSLMPYFQNALKAADDLGVRPARAGAASAATYALCLAVAVPVVLWANYHFGVTQSDFTTYRVPTMAFRATEPAIDELNLIGNLEESKALSPLERLGNMRPRPGFLWFAGAGVALVLAVGFLRLRYHWWPLHPVMFLVWSTWPMAMFCHSFLLGYLAKQAVVRFAGLRRFDSVKTLMLGIIAGDLLGGGLWIIVGAIYHAVTGVEPVKYEIFPM